MVNKNLRCKGNIFFLILQELQFLVVSHLYYYSLKLFINNKTVGVGMFFINRHILSRHLAPHSFIYFRKENIGIRERSGNLCNIQFIGIRHYLFIYLCASYNKYLFLLFYCLYCLLDTTIHSSSRKFRSTTRQYHSISSW